MDLKVKSLKKEKKARFNFVNLKDFWNMFNNLAKLLPKNYQLQVFVLSFLYFLLSLMEVVGIGSIPIFISAIIDNNYLHSKIIISTILMILIFLKVIILQLFFFFVLAIFFIKFIYQFFFLIMKQNSWKTCVL